MATDLRLITAAMKINADLERIGDQAVNIAENAIKILSSPPLKPMIDLPRMAELAEAMTRDSLDAFVRRDSALASLCYPPGEEPVGETLMRPQLGLNRIDWEVEGETDFHLPHGPMVALLRETGFEIEALHELYAPEGPDDEVRFYMRRGWARRWPAEDLWIARRPPG